MRTTKRTSGNKAGTIRAIKVAGFALALLAGVPASEPFAPGGKGKELAAQGVRGMEDTKGLFFFKWCAGVCPGRGAYCCGPAL